MNRNVSIFNQDHLDHLITLPPSGYILNRDPVPTKTKYYGIMDDPIKMPHCIMVLINFLGMGKGFAMWIRVYKSDIFLLNA